MRTTTELAVYAAWTALTNPTDNVARSLVAHVGALDALDIAAHGNADDITNNLATPALAKYVPLAIQYWAKHRQDKGDLIAHGKKLIEDSRGHGITLLPVSGTELDGIFRAPGHTPIALWAKGSYQNTLTPLLEGTRKAITITGGRALNPHGHDAATRLPVGLANQENAPIVITGGNPGVEATSARTCLFMEHTTAAFTTGGLDKHYRVDEDLLRNIATSGGVFSAQPINTLRDRPHFQSRNQILGATTHATILIEAAYRSTARTIAEAAHTTGRTIGLVPGPTTNSPNGCTDLLDTNPTHTHYIETAHDITNTLL